MKEIVTLLQCAEGGVQRRQRKQPADNLLLRKMRWEAVGRAAYDVLLVDVRRCGYQTATGGRSGGEAAAAAGLHYAREWLWIGWVAQNGSTGGVTTAASTLPTDLWENKERLTTKEASSKPIATALLILTRNDQALLIPTRTDQALLIPTRTDQALLIPTRTDQALLIPTRTDQALLIPTRTDQALLIPVYAVTQVTSIWTDVCTRMHHLLLP